MSGDGLQVEGSRSKVKKIGRGGKAYVPAVVGDGVVFGFEKLKPGVLRRIEELGKMNDRRVALVSARNGAGLLELAIEYESRKMPLMAAEIRKEAKVWMNV